MRFPWGLDPLSGLAFATGITASLPLTGTANEVVIEGSILSNQEQTAYIAAGSGGLAIVNASQFQMPILRSRLALPGEATDVSVDSNLQIAVVAANSGGLHFVDVSDPLNPALLRTLNASASQVEVVEGVAYATVASELRSYDILTGEKLQSLAPTGGNLTGLAREGSFLYTMDSGNRLRAINIAGSNMIPGAATANIPNGGRKLFVGNGIAYIAAGNGNTGGFSTANVSNPNSPALSSGVDAANIEGDAIAANGSGLAVTVGYVRGPVGESITALDVVNVSDPTDTSWFITRFPFPVKPNGVAIGSGIAFVAGGTAGLQVVNYRAFDANGVAPTVSITTSALDLSPGTPGLQVQEGSSVPVQAMISDDVQVRNVELLVNGQVVRNDVSFPFDRIASLPTIAANGPNPVTLQVRATDTGGNVGLSPLLTLELTLDTTPPSVSAMNPQNNAIRGQSFRAVTIDFSEPLDPQTVTAATIQLLGTNGTVTPTDIQFRRGNASVQFTHPALAIGDYLVVLNAPQIKDRAGNALGAANITSDFEIRASTSEWVGSGSGNWDNVANWSDGRIPSATDDVLISVPGNATITYGSGNREIRSLFSNNAVTISGGTLTVNQSIQVNNTLRLSEGTLKDATVLAGTGAASVVVTGGTLDAVTLGRDLTVQSGGILYVRNGLTLDNARLILAAGGGHAQIYFGATQTLGGTGEVVFAGGSSGGGINFLYAQGDSTPAGAATLTIGSGILVHGTHSGQISGLYGPDRVINQGTISADTAGKTISLTSVTNQGTVIADAGAISWNNPPPNTNTIRAKAGGLVAISGSFTNTSSGVVSIDIGGTAASQFGRLTVSGAATLDGTLNLALVNGFSPAIGDTFQVMTFGSRTGQFATINGTALGNGKQFSPAYTATNLTLNVTAPSTPAQGTRAAPIPALADSDGDGIPDAQELLAGTNPHDAASTLHLDVTRTADSNVELRFASVAGRTYAVECCTDLQRGVWFTLRDNIPGTGAPIPFIDETAASRGPQCFYRLRVWRP